jgi:hypothetical protein
MPIDRSELLAQSLNVAVNQSVVDIDLVLIGSIHQRVATLDHAGACYQHFDQLQRRTLLAVAHQRERRIGCRIDIPANDRRAAVKRAAFFIRMNDLVCNNQAVIPVVNRPKVQAVSNKLHAAGSGWDNDLWNLKDWYRDA